MEYKDINPLRAVTQNGHNRELSTRWSEIIGNGIPFIAPLELDAILLETTNFSEWLINYIGKESTDYIWDLNLIKDMLEKGYNPTALACAFTSALYCANELKSSFEVSDFVSVIELGTGAGWSTVILYNLLKNQYENFSLNAIDESLYAISCTARMLDHFGIPYRILARGEVIFSRESMESPAIILCCQDFISALAQIKKVSQYAIYSNHGTAYLDQKEHSKLLNQIHNILVPSGFFVADSLDPFVTMDLNKFFVVSSVLLGNNRRRFKNIPCSDRYQFVPSEFGIQRLIKWFDEPSANFLDWLHFLLFNGYFN